MRIFQMVGADAQGRMAGNFVTEQDYRDVVGRLDMRVYELEQSKAREAALQVLLNERDEKLAKYAEFLAWCETAPVGSGVCCCGDNMQGHGNYGDHGAVDEWDHALGNWAKELRK